MNVTLTECPHVTPSEQEPRADIVVCGEVANLYQLGILTGRMLAVVKDYYQRKRKALLEDKDKVHANQP